MRADEGALGQLGQKRQRFLPRRSGSQLLATLDLDAATAGERDDRQNAPCVRARHDSVDRVLGKRRRQRAGICTPLGIEPAGAILDG
jgi:hypothetical protein